ncbi:MAG TPA: hypothetical protein DDW98_14800 [Gammaproteobacteria bacterium]|nr:hypothetical protein [Gammaproteobacteria bacterium]
MLERFEYYNARLCDSLLVAAYNSLPDWADFNGSWPSPAEIMDALPSAVFTPVEGEQPNPTDSGHLLCRRARQLLSIQEANIVAPAAAVSAAAAGTPIVFIDDFIGSGDQFVKTWTREYISTGPKSFAEAYARRPFVAAYIALVSTKSGLGHIRLNAPNVAVSVAHVLTEDSTLSVLLTNRSHPVPHLVKRIKPFLLKYVSRLSPAEAYMQSDTYKLLGYKTRALLLAFEHSVPDATLPIFWSPGLNGWQPLISRA